MDFNLSKQQELIRQLMHDFAENEVKPLAAEIDDTEQFPVETVRKMAKYGMLGINIPAQYGGAGGDTLSYIIAIEELAKVCATTSIILSAHTSLACYPILAYGTEEQKQKYLVPLAKGEKLGAFGLTEPNAGTDSAAQQTVAVLDGDHFVLNGSKCFITNGGYADTFIVFAMTDKSRGNKGISAFIIEKGFKGFSIGKVEHKLGIRASSTTELVFEDCIVPKENLLGDLNKGFKIAMTTLDGGRVGVAAQALGIAEGAFNETIKYMKERIQKTSFRIPGSPVDGCRHEVRNRVLQAPALQGCNGKGQRQAFLHGCCNGKAPLRGNRNGCYHKVRAAPRRLRLFPRISD